MALVVGVAVAAGGTYELVHAKSLTSDLDAMRGPSGAILPERAADARTKYDEISKADTIGVALVAAGGGIALGSVAYLVFAPSPAGAQVAVAGTF